MTTLTLTTFAVVVLGVVGPRGYGVALALGGATAAGSAFVAGGTAVPTFYAVALGSLAGVALRLLGTRPHSGLARFETDRPSPGVGLLVAFAIWASVVTLTASTLFGGIAVHAATGYTTLTSGGFSSSNGAQLIYLVLGVATVAFLARSPSARPEVIGLAAGATTVLSAWRYLHQLAGLPFPDGFFDNSPVFNYIETAPNNVQRFRGILSEPAGLAGSCLVTVAYMLPRSLQVRGLRRVGTLLVAAIAIYLGVISTSATFVVAGVATAMLAVLAGLARFLTRRAAVSVLAQLLISLTVLIALFGLPLLADFVQQTVSQKVNSSSYGDRSSFDDISYRLFIDTFGYGVGLGSNRASSFVANLMSTTGLIGTVLFVAAVVTLIRRGGRVRAYRPVVWALTTLLVAKVIAGPDLSDTSGVLWIALGLLSHAALRRESRPAPPGRLHAADVPVRGGRTR